MILFIDIETVGSGEKLDPRSLTPPGNITKEESIENWYKTKALAKVNEEFSKRGLSPTKKKVICLAYAWEDGKIECLSGTEAEIASGLWDVMNSKSDASSIRLCGHNLRNFDNPSIYRMACKVGHRELINWYNTITNRPRYADCFIDTMEMFAYGTKDMVSLNDLATFFGLEGKNGMDGSQVQKFYDEGKLDEIIEYCKHDVELLRDIYFKLI